MISRKIQLKILDYVAKKQDNEKPIELDLSKPGRKANYDYLVSHEHLATRLWPQPDSKHELFSSYCYGLTQKGSSYRSFLLEKRNADRIQV